MIIDHQNVLFKAIDTLLQFMINPYSSMVDFGCGPGQHTRNLRCPNKLYIDVVQTDDRPSPFVRMWEKDFWSRMHHAPDVILGLDFLEHLPKEEGYRFLIRSIHHAKLVILFCPEGWYEVPDAEGPDQHQAAWTAQEMEELGFQVWFAPKFHPDLGENGLGAFLAWIHNDGKLFTAEEAFQMIR